MGVNYVASKGSFLYILHRTKMGLRNMLVVAAEHASLVLDSQRQRIVHLHLGIRRKTTRLFASGYNDAHLVLLVSTSMGNRLC